MLASVTRPLPDPSPGLLRAMLDLFSRPLQALVRAVRTPKSGWVPYLVLVLGSLLAAGLYFHHVDLAWLSSHILARVPRASRSHMAREFTPTALEVSTLAGTFLSLSVGLVIVAAYYYLMLSLGGDREATFFRILSLTSWTSLPGILGALAALGIVLASGPHLGLGALAPTSLAYLLHLRPGSPFYDAASSFSILMPWSWALITLAFVRIYGYRLDRALAVVLVPYVVYYLLLMWA